MQHQHGQSAIHLHPGILSGKPVFRGSRAPFQTLLDHVESDGKRGFEEFLEGYGIPREQAMAALAQHGKLHLLR